MTVDLEWLVYFGIYSKDFAAVLEKGPDESHRFFVLFCFFYVISTDLRNGVVFQPREDLSSWTPLSFAVKKTPTNDGSVL